MRLGSFAAAAALTAALILGATAAAATAPAAFAPTPVAVPPTRALAVAPLTARAAGDTLTYRLTWARAVDALGPAERYTVLVTGASGDLTTMLTKAQSTTDTSVVLVIAAPPFGSSVLATATVTAVRRGQTSAPATLTWTVARPDAPPPAPTGLSLDSLPVTAIGAVTAADCTAGSGRLLTAGPHLDTRADTAFFVRALPALPLQIYCVDPTLVVLAEGDPVVAGQAPRDSVTTFAYPAGAVLPYASPGSLTVPAPDPAPAVHRGA